MAVKRNEEPRVGVFKRRRSQPMAPLQIENGRGERIRTSGLYVPNVALYQAKLHPESVRAYNAALYFTVGGVAVQACGRGIIE
jgi:hypothetical protein